MPTSRCTGPQSLKGGAPTAAQLLPGQPGIVPAGLVSANSCELCSSNASHSTYLAIRHQKLDILKQELSITGNCYA